MNDVDWMMGNVVDRKERLLSIREANDMAREVLFGHEKVRRQAVKSQS